MYPTDLESNLMRAGKSLPSQHGVRLGGEDGWIHHKSGVVHDQSDSFSEPQATAVALFAAQVIHVDGIAHSLGAVVCWRRTKGPGHVATERRSSTLGAPWRAWTGRSR